MKALKFIKKIEFRIDDFDGKIIFTANDIDEVREVLSELEALQQPEQCNTCSFYHSFTGVCANDKCPLCADFVDTDFGCIYHEVKEQL